MYEIMFTYVHCISTCNLLGDLFMHLCELTISFGIKNSFYILIHRCIYTLPTIHLVCNENEKLWDLTFCEWSQTQVNKYIIKTQRAGEFSLPLYLGSSFFNFRSSSLQTVVISCKAFTTIKYIFFVRSQNLYAKSWLWQASLFKIIWLFPW